MKPHHIAPGHVIYELFKNSSTAREIHIQTSYIICCQLSLTLSVICYFGNDLYSCGIRLVRSFAHWCNVPGMLSKVRLGRSVFSLLLQWFTGGWFLSLSSTHCFAFTKPAPRIFRITSAFTITQYRNLNSTWNATISMALTSCVILHLHSTLQPIKHFFKSTAQQWARFTDSINYA